MECHPLVILLATEVISNVLDTVLGRIRHRLISLHDQYRKLRFRVRYLEDHRVGIAMRSPLSMCIEAIIKTTREIKEATDRDRRSLHRKYKEYRAYHNLRWGRPEGGRWRELPEAARRGYPGRSGGATTCNVECR